MTSSLSHPYSLLLSPEASSTTCQESSEAGNEILGEMVELHYQRKALARWKLIGRCAVSCISVLLAQFALSLVPRFFSASPLLIQVALSGSLSLSGSSTIYTRLCVKIIGFETFNGLFLQLWYCWWLWVWGDGLGGLLDSMPQLRLLFSSMFCSFGLFTSLSFDEVLVFFFFHCPQELSYSSSKK